MFIEHLLLELFDPDRGRTDSNQQFSINIWPLHGHFYNCIYLSAQAWHDTRAILGTLTKHDYALKEHLKIIKINWFCDKLCLRFIESLFQSEFVLLIFLGLQAPGYNEMCL